MQTTQQTVVKRIVIILTVLFPVIEEIGVIDTLWVAAQSW